MKLVHCASCGWLAVAVLQVLWAHGVSGFSSYLDSISQPPNPQPPPDDDDDPSNKKGYGVKAGWKPSATSNNNNNQDRVRMEEADTWMDDTSFTNGNSFNNENIQRFGISSDNGWSTTNGNNKDGWNDMSGGGGDYRNNGNTNNNNGSTNSNNGNVNNLNQNLYNSNPYSSNGNGQMSFSSQSMSNPSESTSSYPQSYSPTTNSYGKSSPPSSPWSAPAVTVPLTGLDSTLTTGRDSYAASSEPRQPPISAASTSRTVTPPSTTTASWGANSPAASSPPLTTGPEFRQPPSTTSDPPSVSVKPPSTTTTSWATAASKSAVPNSSSTPSSTTASVSSTPPPFRQSSTISPQAWRTPASAPDVRGTFSTATSTTTSSKPVGSSTQVSRSSTSTSSNFDSSSKSSEPYFLSSPGSSSSTSPSSQSANAPPSVTVNSWESASVKATEARKNPLDSFVDLQLEMMNVDEKILQDMLKQTLREKAGTYNNLLKKHFRLALTGGVSVQKKLAVERPIPDLDTKGMTERIMKRMRTGREATGARVSTTWDDFLTAEENWARLREYMPGKNDPVPPPFVVENDIATGLHSPKCFEKLNRQRDTSLDYDIAVCGGTMGIFYATALQLRGFRVCVVEAGPLRGREQEWNISMDELMRLVKLGVLSEEDLDDAIQTEFPGCRAGFKNKEVPLRDGYTDNGIGFECFTEGVMNLGVSPAILVERAAERFEEIGGVIKENNRIGGVFVATSIGGALDLGEYEEPLTANIIIDAMGNNSPITRQQRYGTKPDGVCVVVGTEAAGYDPETNVFGDIIYTNTPIQNKKKNGKLQYFWEAFPVGIGRNGMKPGSSDVKTTYMFTYMDAKQKRPKLETIMEDYWRLLPQYQPSIENPETDLYIQRVLFAYFPTYKDSPLPSGFDRILAVGDAAGIQTPLSFGGFGALTRHLERLTEAVTEAVDHGLVGKEHLSEINPYAPNLSASWMFQKAMSVQMGQLFVDPRFINRLLATNFEVMDKMGPRTMKPFLQDVVRFDGLVGTLIRSLAADPTCMPSIIAWIGLPTLVDWMGHVGMMGTYAALDNVVTPFLRPIGDRTFKSSRTRFHLHRKMDAWKYGSGNDYDVKSLPKD